MSLAVPDQEGPVPPSLQQLLRLLPFHTANVPAPLLLVGIVCEGVRAGGFHIIKIHVINKNPTIESLCLRGFTQFTNRNIGAASIGWMLLLQVSFKP